MDRVQGALRGEYATMAADEHDFVFLIYILYVHLASLSERGLV